MTQKVGYVTQVIGPVVDVIFEGGGVDLPPIYEALEIERGEWLEVDCRGGTTRGRRYRALCSNGYNRRFISRYEGLDLGRTLTMPMGDQIKGRLLNVTG